MLQNKKRELGMKEVVSIYVGQGIKIHFGKIISPVNTSIGTNSPSLSLSTFLLRLHMLLRLFSRLLPPYTSAAAEANAQRFGMLAP